MNAELKIAKAVSQVANRCNVGAPSSIVIRNGPRYASNFDKKTGAYVFYQPIGNQNTKAQDPFLHEAGHLVRRYNERTLGVGLGLKEELNRVSEIVDKTVDEHGVLGEYYLNLWSLMFENHLSAELIGSYFGMDFDDQDSLTQARNSKSSETLRIFKQFQQEWRQEIIKISNSKEGVKRAITYLKFAEKGGKTCGIIIGHILAIEGANPRGVMLHDPTRLLTSVKKLTEQDSFPENLEEFLRGTKVLGIPHK
jgi:hypothetical protein